MCKAKDRASPALHLAMPNYPRLTLEVSVNRDQLEGQWTQLKGEAQRQWGKLTNDDLDVVKGDAKKLAGKIQERYGKSMEDAEREVELWIENR